MAVELRLALSFYYYQPHPPGKVEMQLEIEHSIWSVGKWWLDSLVYGARGSFEWHWIEEIPHKFEIDQA